MREEQKKGESKDGLKSVVSCSRSVGVYAFHTKKDQGCLLHSKMSFSYGNGILKEVYPGRFHPHIPSFPNITGVPWATNTPQLRIAASPLPNSPYSYQVVGKRHFPVLDIRKRGPHIPSAHFFTLREILHILCFLSLIPFSCFTVTEQLKTHTRTITFHFLHPSFAPLVNQGALAIQIIYKEQRQHLHESLE